MAEDEADQTAVPLDDVDRNIIAELTRDGRMSVTQVAENVHISRAHAYTRIARLTGEGVLTKFTALVDPIKAGLKSSAFRGVESTLRRFASSARCSRVAASRPRTLPSTPSTIQTPSGTFMPPPG